jgi:hypothetical protein
MSDYPGSTGPGNDERQSPVDEAGALLAKITRWLTSPPHWDTGTDYANAAQLMRESSASIRELLAIVTGSAEPAGDAAVATGAESTAALTNSTGCIWNLDDVGGDSVWETQCKNAFYFEGDGTAGPLDAGFTVCPYCGKALAESRRSDDVAQEGQQPPAVEPRQTESRTRKSSS